MKVDLHTTQDRELYEAIKNQILTEKLTELYVSDSMKPAFAPVETLAKEMVDRSILVLSDAGLLIAVLRRLKSEGLSIDAVRFVAHTEEVRDFVLKFGVQVELVCYNQLQDWLRKDMGLKFDIVVGNPPYQEASDLREGESKRSSIRLWEQFLKFGIESLHKGGDLMFITPAGWMGITSTSFDLLKSKSVVHADVSAKVKNSFPTVGGSMRFSTYWVKNEPSSGPVKIKFDDGEFDLHIFDMEFQPVKSSFGLDYSICQKLHSFTSERLIWKRQDHPHTPLAKYEVLVHRAKATSYDARVCVDGSEIGYAYSTNSKNDAEAVASNMNRKLYKRLRWVLRTGMALSSTFTKLPVPRIKMTDAELYQHFALSQQEIDLIESLEK
jgi:hypothetical protein